MGIRTLKKLKLSAFTILYLVVLLRGVKIFANEDSLFETKQTAATDSISVLGLSEDITQVGLYIASHKGYFKDNGLKVKIVKDQSMSKTSLLLSKQVDFIFIRSDELLKQRSFGYPIVAVASVIPNDKVYLAYNIDIEFEGVNSLIDKVWGHWGAEFEDKLVEDIFASAGFNADNIKKQPISNKDLAKNFKNGVDFAFVYPFWHVIYADMSGVNLALFDLAKLNLPVEFPILVLAARQSFLKQNRLSTQKFLTSLATAYDWLENNPNKAAAILAAQFYNLNRELLVKSLNYYAIVLRNSKTSWGLIDTEQWANFKKWMISKGLIKDFKGYDPDFSNQYILKY